jgi:hypothetical protein
MAEYSCPITLATGAGTITFNGTGDVYMLVPEQCDGLDSPETRVNVDDRPQIHGGIKFPTLKKARHIVLAGYLLPASNEADDRNAMEDALLAALDSILDTDGTLTQTPSGGSSRSLTVQSTIGLKCVGGYLKTFSFGLVAADPDWA